MALRIGVFLTSPTQAGGGFRLSLATMVLLANATRIQHNFTFFTTYRENVTVLRNFDIDAQYIRYGRTRRALGNFAQHSRAIRKLNRVLFSPLGLILDPSLDGILKRNSIDLAYFLEPTIWASYLLETNYVTTLFDLCHREVIEFPEVRQPFESREGMYRFCLPRAVAVITNWSSLAEQITQYYDIDRRRVFVLPQLPQVAVQRYDARSVSASIKTKYRLQHPYVFYPANFWAHKNHVYILEALALLREKRQVIVHAAFCGVDRGSLHVVQQTASRLAVSGQIHFFGLVSDNEICGLYERALALVMPTYFGPTNMPPLEAATLGCPIVYSDLEPFRQQFGDAALYCDLRSPESLAIHIERLITDSELSVQLATRARDVIPKDAEVRYQEILGRIFDRFEFISKRWK